MPSPLRAAAPIEMQERSVGAVDPAAWYRFVFESRGSFLGSWKVIRVESLLRTVRIFEFFLTNPSGRLKIGQCAVAVANRRVRFLDRLHLLPDHAETWADGLRQVFARCGAATYAYG